MSDRDATRFCIGGQMTGGDGLREGPAEAVLRFDYPASPDACFVPSWTGWEGVSDADRGSERSRMGSSVAAPGGEDLDRRLLEERQRSFEAGRNQGVIEGREIERAAHAAAHAAATETQVRKLADWFLELDRQRGEYFRTVEEEVVKLAMAIASRILRREAQTDPLLLMGAVRVALAQVAASTEVRLRVPAQDAELWSEAVALLPNIAARPGIVADEAMKVGQCVLETSLGRADVSVSRQLTEIERALGISHKGVSDPSLDGSREERR